MVKGKDSQKITIDPSQYLFKAKKFFIDAENYFDKNEEFLQTGLLLFIHLLDKKKIKEITNKILNDSVNSTDLRGPSTYIANYFYDWSQKDYYEQTKLNAQYFTKFNTSKIDHKEIDKNKKINIGFVSPDFYKAQSIP